MADTLAHDTMASNKLLPSTCQLMAYHEESDWANDSPGKVSPVREMNFIPKNGPGESAREGERERERESQ